MGVSFLPPLGQYLVFSVFFILAILVGYGVVSHHSFFFFFCCTACGILVPWPGIEPGPQQWEHWVLITGLPGNSLTVVLICVSLLTNNTEFFIVCLLDVHKASFAMCLKVFYHLFFLDLYLLLLSYSSYFFILGTSPFSSLWFPIHFLKWLLMRSFLILRKFNLSIFFLLWLFLSLFYLRNLCLFPCFDSILIFFL